MIKLKYEHKQIHSLSEVKVGDRLSSQQVLDTFQGYYHSNSALTVSKVNKRSIEVFDSSNLRKVFYFSKIKGLFSNGLDILTTSTERSF